MNLLKLFRRKTILIGFKLTEVRNGKETIVFQTIINPHSPCRFRKDKSADYIAEAIYGDLG